MEVKIDFSLIQDWETFHSLFKKVMGFPDFYGHNMNAWIDCMSYIDDPESGMSSVTVDSGGNLEIIASHIETTSKDHPEILQGFIECTAFVNQSFVEAGRSTRLKIIPV